MKKILITSGGTREYLDEVRVLTNISSGKLGAIIAERFLEEDDDYEIHYVSSATTIIPNCTNGDVDAGYIHFHTITDVQSAYDTIKKLAPEMNLIIHCMAVSDFSFKPCATKLKSSDPEAFIESLKDRIIQTPKILKEIRNWNNWCDLVSFKFEVGLGHEELIKIARTSGITNGCDLVIANDKSEMVQAKKHIAYAIPIDQETFVEPIQLEDKEAIAEFIFEYFRK